MRNSLERAARPAAVLVLPFAFGACTWFTDFKKQPKIDPWEPMSQNENDTTTPPRGQPKYSVPITGTSAAAYMVSYGNLPNVIDSLAPVPNPVPVDERSVDNGRKNYQINCAVCHGIAGNGNPKAAASGIIGIPLMSDRVMNQLTDGYIYGMMRNGRGLMPSYNRIEERDRWDIVNYIRTLQGKTSFKPDSSPAGYPGQNGTSVPGPSVSAPTLPAPYLHPTPTPTGGKPNVNSATYKGGNNGGAASHDAPAGEAKPAADSKEKH
jgi:mono/diheme cytochrome c family protein